MTEISRSGSSVDHTDPLKYNRAIFCAPAVALGSSGAGQCSGADGVPSFERYGSRVR